MGKYQNVGTPRFYVDYFQYALTIGLITADDISNDIGQDNNELKKLFYLNPTNPIYLDMEALSINTKLQNNLSTFNYFMVLNHDLHESDEVFVALTHSINEQLWGGFDYTGRVNDCANEEAMYNGWSLCDLTWVSGGDGSQEVLTFAVANQCNIGAISIGTSYTMPYSPDLNLTMTREFGGAKKQFTRGGTLLSDHNYTQPPTWGDGEAWGLYTNAPINLGARRAGRRTWDLKFSYLSASDIMADLEMLTIYNTESTDIDDNPTGYEDYVSDTNFFSQFMQKTLGGSLRFIFQPDGSDYNPDGFAICILDQDSISIKQVAHNTYNISLRIMEVW